MSIKQHQRKRIIVSLPTVRADPYWRFQPPAKPTPAEELPPEPMEEKQGRKLGKESRLPDLGYQADRAAFLKSSIQSDGEVYPEDELLLSLRSLLVNDLAMATELDPQKPAGRTTESMITDVIDNPGKYKTKAVILPLVDQGMYLTKKVRSLFGQLWLPAGMITVDNANDCLRALVEDYVVQACFWNPEHVQHPRHLICRTPRFDQTMSRYLPPHAIELPDRFLNIQSIHEKFEIEVVGQLRAFVHDLVHKTLQGGTWNICFVQRFPGGVSIMVGPDFRALDWERRMESGEWE